ncbi:hypothetical protein B0H16DRAFT_1876125 [Mycena metata]|uniref:Protein kinase domain-containing protein n=1 Tax=Mycena metata TaxID=1033252 RepID=A0AAD7P3D3_9AGAR|nr:hypothetical protein B0H16DRAFT_1876125 [Mycena metata]
MSAFPFDHTVNRPLYVVGESVPISSIPSLDPLFTSDRISSRADSLSAFFKALCQRYRPPEHVSDEAASEESSAVLPCFLVNWTYEPPPPKEGQPSPPQEIQSVAIPVRRPAKPLPERLRGGVLQKAIYKPHGKWAWTAGLPFRDSEAPIILSSGVMCSAFIKTGHIGDRPVKYVSKVWLTKEKWHGFFSELALYKVQLKSLQGRVVPSIINVYSCAGAVDVAMEPPHHSFWIEASTDMPHVLKKRCVKAFEELHAAGVYHGDVELRHMLIGGDARVTIIDFQASRALVPNKAVKLAAATPDELRLEMRKVKFKLDYEDARTREDEKIMRGARLERRNRRGFVREQPLPEDVRDPPIDSSEWNLEWIGTAVEPARFVMPGQSVEDLKRAVGQFLDVLDKLEKEEELSRDEVVVKQRRASPDFKPPEIVPLKPLDMRPPGKGFGATVVHPTGSPRGALKRKGDSDRSQEDKKRIRIDPSPIPPALKTRHIVHKHPSPIPPESDSPPPLKTRRMVYKPPSPCPSPVPVVNVAGFVQEPLAAPLPTGGLVRSLMLPLSPGKRKRVDEDTCDEPPDTRGKPKARTTSALDDATDAMRCPTTPEGADVVLRSKDASFVAVKDASKSSPKYTVSQSAPVLFRWIENIWRFVA